MKTNQHTISLWRVRLALGMTNDLLTLKRGGNPTCRYAENCMKLRYAMSKPSV